MREAKKSLYSYCGPGAALAVAALLLLLIGLLCAGRAQSLADDRRSQTPAPFDSLAENAPELVYLDLVGVSDAMAPNTGDRYYYIAEDSFHVFRIACLTLGEYDTLGAQKHYWNSQEAAEEAVHLTGVSVRIPDAVKESVMAVFDMDGESFDANFGTRCFMTEVPPEPQNAVGWIVLSVVSALAAIACIALWLLRFFAADAALLRLEQNGRLDAATDELLDNATELARGDRLRMGENYLFGWHNGLAAAWEDVIWCYGHSLSLGKKPFARRLVIATADGKRHSVFFSAGEEKALRRLTEQLAAHSDSLLLGDSPKNRTAWREACED